MLPLFALRVSADEPVKVKIPLILTSGTKVHRGLTNDVVDAYYYGALSAVHTSVSSNLGEIDITVTNCSTGELWEGSFDSSITSHHILLISSNPGMYNVLYTIESGEFYEGEFEIY